MLLPGDWHEIADFSEGTILLVLSSEYYDPTDYVYEKPENDRMGQLAKTKSLFLMYIRQDPLKKYDVIKVVKAMKEFS